MPEMGAFRSPEGEQKGNGRGTFVHQRQRIETKPDTDTEPEPKPEKRVLRENPRTPFAGMGKTQASRTDGEKVVFWGPGFLLS